MSAHATLRFAKDCYYFRPTHPCLNRVEVLLRDPAPEREEPPADADSQHQGGAEPESAVTSGAPSRPLVSTASLTRLTTAARYAFLLTGMTSGTRIRSIH